MAGDRLERRLVDALRKSKTPLSEDGKSIDLYAALSRDELAALVSARLRLPTLADAHFVLLTQVLCSLRNIRIHRGSLKTEGGRPLKQKGNKETEPAAPSEEMQEVYAIEAARKKEAAQQQASSKPVDTSAIEAAEAQRRLDWHNRNKTKL